MIGAAGMGSLGVSLVAWLVGPAVLYALALGAGLLVERLSGFRLSNALLAPVGVCALVVLVMPGYRLGAGAALAAPLALAAAVAGLVLARRHLRERLNPGWAGAAGLVVFGLYLAPVVLAGGWTWTGYNFVNDTAVQLLLADHLAATGVTAPPGPPVDPPQSTALEHVRIYFITEYPLGSHALLATLWWLVPVELAAHYQPLIAGLAALAAMAATTVVRGLPIPGWVAALAGGLALAASLTYNYGLQGNLKEIALLAALFAAFAVASEALSGSRVVRGVGVTAVCLAAALAFYSTAVGPYLAAFAVALLILAVVRRGTQVRRLIGPATFVGLGVFLIAGLSTLVTAVRFGQVAQGTFDADAPVAELGHLLRPLPLSQVLGVWLGGDYRLPQERADLGLLLLVVVGALALAGLVVSLVRRQIGLPLAGATLLIALLVFEPRLSPYAAGKMLALASPAVVLAAVAGGWAALRRWPAAATAAVGLVAAGVVYSDAYAYREVRLAPVDRMMALRDIGERYEGRGLVLLDEFEEYAKYFMQPARVNVALETITAVHVSQDLAATFIPKNADLDQMPLQYVQRFGVIVQRRGPDSSRPPANYRLDAENRYYRAWVRTPAPALIAHHPIQGAFEAGASERCDDIRTFAAGAPPGSRIAAAGVPEQVRFEPPEEPPSGWRRSELLPRGLVPAVPGTLSGRERFTGGAYGIWLLGSTGRPLHVEVDGRRVATVQGVTSPGEWLYGGRATIAAGTRRVSLVRPGGGLGPGDAYAGVIGPVVFARLGSPPPLLTVAPSDAARLCGRRLDWLEVVQTAGEPVQADEAG